MPDDLSTHITKNRRTGTFFAIGTEAECQTIADDLNTDYQTDEHYVEPYDPERGARA